MKYEKGKVRNKNKTNCAKYNKSRGPQSVYFFCRQCANSGEQVLNNLATSRRLYPLESGLYRPRKCSSGMYVAYVCL